MNIHLAPALGLALLLIPATARAADPVVSNLAAVQRAGTRLVDISYDVTADAPTVFVSLEISSDAGTTFSVPAPTVSGAIGAGVAVGVGKTITWNAGADWIGQYSARMRFKVMATEIPVGFSFIPAGAFAMGDSLDGMTAAPTRTVTLSAFYMDQKEVTKAEWDAVRTWAVSHGYTDLAVGAGKAADHPVQTVSWWDVVKWCNARSEKEGLTPCYTVSGSVMKTGTTEPSVNWTATGYRLPTEAEWEKAARGGLSGKRFPWGDTISHTQANFQNTGGETYQTGTTGYHPTYRNGGTPYTAPVGSFTANGYGLQDMAGNVWEWCWDWYGSYASGAQTDPRGPASGSNRLYRGGSWYYFALNCRAAFRYYDAPGRTHNAVGFRPARSSVTAADAGSGYAVGADGVVDTRYELTSVTPTNGTISGVVAAGKYVTGTTATLTAVPAPGYAFAGWAGAASGTVNPLSLLMNSDKTIGATFTRQYTLTASALSNGSISGIAANGKYVTGTTATLTAAPAAGYAFTGWTGAASGAANPLSLLMDADKTIGATFMWQCTLTSSAVSNGSISGIATEGKYVTGTTATLTAVPAAGYAFTGWTGAASGTANPLSLLMNSDQTIGASFTRQYTLTVSAMSNGSISGIAVDGKYLTGTSATLTAVSAAGYAFTGWTGAASGTTNPLSLLMDADKTIGANFTRQYTLTASALSNGTISGIAVDGKYLTGTTATLTAVPADGYAFTGWTGAASGTVNPLSLLMNSDKTIGANFTSYTSDTDNDGLTYHQETALYGTNPELADTDGDGINDGDEIAQGRDPLLSEPVVSNVTFAQRAGTKLVDISYDVTTETPTVIVSLEISSDGGATFSVPATTMSGAIGAGVAIGTGKIITWDAGADWIGLYSARMRYKVTAMNPPVGMSLIPAGAFTMGDSFSEGNTWERPTRTVTLSAFYMGPTEVTKAAWDAVRTWAVSHGYTDLSAGAGKAANHPVQTVTWWDVIKWCNARSEKEGFMPCYTVSGSVMKSGTTVPTVNWTATGYRLPTEAEWEKAARGGLSGKRFPWGDTISHTQANFYNVGGESYQTGTTGYHPTYRGSSPYTSPVGSFVANGYGLYDMAGNVFEWCWDWFATYASGAQTDPRGVSSGSSFRVTRGGDWNRNASYCRAGYRGNFNGDPAYSDSTRGFRIARSSFPAAGVGSGYAVSADGGVDTRYELTSVTPTSGTISGVVADAKYVTGSAAVLTAVPADGYAFTGWTGAATGTVNPLSLLMNGDKTIGASFTRQYILTASAVSDGNISGVAVDGKYLTGTTATLTAVPAAAYVFTGWTGAASGTVNPISLLMDADKTIGATFTRQYTLTASAVSNGTIGGIVAGGKYLTGTTATLTAVPAAGYAFTGWTGDATGTANPLSLLVDSDKTIGASFTRQYTLTASALTNGSISGFAADGKYLTGTTATLTAVPAEGYVFTRWTGAASGTVNPLALLMNGNKTIGATFTRQYALTTTPLSDGSISGIAVDGKYLTGTTATLTAVPAAGYAFTGWMGDATGPQNPLSLVMNSDKTIGATFTRQYTLTSDPLSNGMITGMAAGGNYLTGTTATLSAVPAAGYAFTGWTGAASGTDNPLSLLMDADKAIGANFTRQYTLTASALVNGSISGIAADGKYLTGTTATLSAVPAADYVFTGWTGAASGTTNPLALVMNSDKTIGATYVRGIEVLVDGQLPAGSGVVGRGSLKVTMQTAFANGTILYTLDGSAPSLGSKLYTTAVMIGRSCTVRAVAYSSDFSSTMQSPPLAVVIVPVLTATTAGGGGIGVDPPAGAYAADAMATLTATPAAGWTFLQWLGDASGTDPVARVQMSRNKYAQAVFGTAVNTTTVGSGSIWQNPLAALYPYGTRIRFSGLPASGNYLAFWGNAVTSTDNPLDFPVTQPNQTVTAVFQPLGVGQFALALVAEGGGKVAATPAANRYSSGASVRVTAQPDVGQEFVGWSGDAAGSINPLTVAMSQSKAITAMFTKRPGLRVDTALEGLVEEGFRLTLMGEFGKQYEILGSGDLVNWMQAGTLTNVHGTSQFTDGAATNQPRRFYRAVRMEP